MESLGNGGERLVWEAKVEKSLFFHKAAISQQMLFG